MRNCVFSLKSILPSNGRNFFQGICSYIMYWAMEDGKTANGGNAIYDSFQMSPDDCDRVCSILESIVKDGWVVKTTDHYQLANCH